VLSKTIHLISLDKMFHLRQIAVSNPDYSYVYMNGDPSILMKGHNTPL
jgi:hypothetical protein